MVRYIRERYVGGIGSSAGNPIAAAIARTFSALVSALVPKTAASRALSTTFQFRHTYACTRSGKCRNSSAGGAEPTGRFPCAAACAPTHKLMKPTAIHL